MNTADTTSERAYLIEILANTTLRPDKVTARTRYYVGTAIRSTKCGRTRTGTHGHLTRDARHFGFSRASPHVTPLGRDGYWKCPALAPDAPAVILLSLPTVAKAAASRAVAYTEQSRAIRTAIRLMTQDGHSECRTGSPTCIHGECPMEEHANECRESTYM